MIRHGRLRVGSKQPKRHWGQHLSGFDESCYSLCWVVQESFISGSESLQEPCVFPSLLCPHGMVSDCISSAPLVLHRFNSISNSGLAYMISSVPTSIFLHPGSSQFDVDCISILPIPSPLQQFQRPHAVDGLIQYIQGDELSLDHNPWIPNQIHQSPVFIDHFPIIFVNPIVNHPQFYINFWVVF